MIASRAVHPDPLECARLAATLAANLKAVRPGAGPPQRASRMQTRRGGVGDHRVMPAANCHGGVPEREIRSSTSVNGSAGRSSGLLPAPGGPLAEDAGRAGLSGEDIRETSDCDLAVAGNYGERVTEKVSLDGIAAQKIDVAQLAPAGVYGRSLDRGDDLLAVHRVQMEPRSLIKGPARCHLSRS